MQIPIEDIAVKKRVRVDLGDIEALAESLRRYGQISPILVDKKNRLIAGHRRLEAARRLGWRTIGVTVVEAHEELLRLELEVEENLQRRDFSADEKRSAFERLRKLRNPGILRRMWHALRHFLARLFGLDE